MPSLPAPISVQYTEIAYYKQETVVENNPAPIKSNYAGIAYQEQETVVESKPILELPQISGTTVTGGFGWIKAVINIVRFPFSGLAWSFDGSKFEQFPSQETPVIFPIIVSDEYIIITCGMEEDGSLVNDILEYGSVRQIIYNNTGKDLLALVSFNKGQDVYLVDDIGNVVKKLMPSEAVLLKNGWKLVSSDPFIAFVRKV